MYGHLHFATDENWISVSAGLIKGLSRRVLIYSGAGLSQYSEYRKYYDDEGILGKNGDYWIKDHGQSDLKANFLFGVFVILDSAKVGQIGVETEPFGITFGFGLILF